MGDTYNQGSGSNLDFDLGTTDTYTQGSGSNIDFKLGDTQVFVDYDMAIKETDKSLTVDVDTAIQQQDLQTTVDVDTVLQAENTVTVDYDTAIREEGKTTTVDYDMVLSESFETSTDYDAVIQDKGKTQTVDYDTTLVSRDMVTTDYDAYIAFGRPGATTYYVGKTEIDTVQELKIKERLNELDTFEGKIYVPDDSARSDIQEGNEFKVFEGNDLVFKGRLEDVEYESNFLAKVEGFGMGVLLLNRKTDRKEYNNTSAEEIVKDQVDAASNLNRGTIENAPDVSIRFDHDNRLKATAGVANAVAYDWIVKQKKDDDFDKDYLDFKSRIGATSSQKTFDIGNNARMVGRDKDTEHVANDITLLGRGDGINQLEARVFAATKKQTVTTEKLSSGSTGTVGLDDASQLGSDGESVDVRVGTEVITGTLDTTNDELNISSRGQNDYNGNSTEDITHYDGIQVWLQENNDTGEGPYKPTDSGAQSGSSIDTYGVREEKVTDKTIINKSTLEKVADNELKDRKEDIFRIQVRPTENRVKDEVSLGDDVTVKDVTAMDVDDSFRIVGFDYHRGTSEKMIIHCANRPLRLTERLKDIERDTDAEGTHMQGSTNIDSQNFGDNCDNSHPLKTEVRIPDDAVAVNKVEVGFTRESFRGYVKNTDHSHDVDVTHPSHSHDVTHPSHSHGVTVAENLNHGMAWFNPGDTQDTSSNTFELNVSTLDPPTGNFDGMQATIQIWNKTGSSDDYDWQLEDSDGNVVASASNKTIGDNNFFSWNKSLSSSDISSNETLTLKVTDGVIGTDSSKGIEGGVSLILASKADETSSTELGSTETSTSSLGTTSTETSTNAGSPSYGIFEPNSEPNIDVDVVIDGNTVKTVSDVSVGQKVDPIDVQSELSTPIAGNYHTIKLVPKDTGGGNGGRSRLNATVFSKVFVESKL